MLRDILQRSLRRRLAFNVQRAHIRTESLLCQFVLFAPRGSNNPSQASRVALVVWRVKRLWPLLLVVLFAGPELTLFRKLVNAHLAPVGPTSLPRARRPASLAPAASFPPWVLFPAPTVSQVSTKALCPFATHVLLGLLRLVGPHPALPVLPAPISPRLALQVA